MTTEPFDSMSAWFFLAPVARSLYLLRQLLMYLYINRELRLRSVAAIQPGPELNNQHPISSCSQEERLAGKSSVIN